MRIEIATKSTNGAAAEIKALMVKHGGSWIVNAVGSEGYVLAMLGTIDGARLLRSRAAGIAGIYCAGIDVRELTSQLRDAREAYYAAYGPDYDGQDDGESEFIPAPELVAMALKESPMTMKQLSDQLERPYFTIVNSIAALRRAKRIAIEGKLPRVKGKGGECIYGLAA